MKELKKVSLNKLIPVFALSIISGVALRCVQIAMLIETETGFYSKNSIITIILNFIILVACALAFFVSLISEEKSKIRTNNVKNKSVFVTALIFGLSFFMDSFGSFVTSAAKQAENGYAVVGDFKDLFKLLMSSGSLPLLLQSFFGLFAGIYFIIVAVSFLKGNATASKTKILALSPVIWVVFRLIYLFVRKISFVRVSDLFFELIMLGFMGLFFMAFAQVTSNVYNDGYNWKILGYGVPAAIIAGILNISRLVFSIVNSEKFINPNHPFRTADFFFVMFILALMLTMIKLDPISVTSEEDAGEITEE